MGWFQRIFGQGGAQAPAPDDDYWYTARGPQAATGYEITPDTAMRCSAVLACTRVLSEDVGKLPLILYRRKADGGKERATDHPLYRLLHDRPNDWQTSFEWREMEQGHLELRGNAYCFIQRNRRGVVEALVPLHPDKVAVLKADDGRPIYQIDGQRHGANKIFHLKGLSANGYTGVSVISLARDAVGLAIATERHGSKFFSNGARLGSAIKHPNKMSKEAQDRFKENWNAVHQGVENSHKVAILEEGMEYQQIGITNEDAQFLETRKFQVTDIARIFRVPPHKIGDLERATFTNIEHQALEYVTDSLLPRLTRWEQAITRDLLREDEREEYFVEFLVDGLLRGDIKSRYEAYTHARNWGWLSANDIRRLENMDPIENGDIYLQPLNMVPAGTEPKDSPNDKPIQPDNPRAPGGNVGAPARKA